MIKPSICFDGENKTLAEYRVVQALHRMKNTEEGGQIFLELLEDIQGRLDRRLRTATPENFQAVQGASQLLQDLLEYVSSTEELAEKLLKQLRK